jgi:hypothetical protein
MEKKYKLDIDPSILELLGPNLYTNIYYVLAELIANAYDADAKNVYIISNPNEIRVEDDGHGMSYGEEIDKFLKVAGGSRENEDQAFTRSGERRKMGRKGVGKLAALSVSESVDVMTIADGDKSGFVLARLPRNKENELQPIEDKDITFSYIEDHGTAIVMRQPKYELNKTLNAVKRNLLKIFPLVNADFRIHIIHGKEKEVVDKFEENIISELNTLITLGDEYSILSELVSDDYPERRGDLVEQRPAYRINLSLTNKDGEEKEYELVIEGWIGTYRSTRGRKLHFEDFPDNFISIFANKKMGEFNILPAIGQNKLIEVFVVGQLHIDLFELSELPDMALSNRQGYKSDDKRYVVAKEYIRDILLRDILRKRGLWVTLKNAGNAEAKTEAQKKNEEKLREAIDKFKKDASKKAAENIRQLTGNTPNNEVVQVISDSINDSMPNLGIKTKVDSQKKKILISHTSLDQSLADVVYKSLLFNNVPKEDIVYTSSEDGVCRIPENYSIYEYLRDFFVESYSTEKIYVLFVTSENIQQSWPAMMEVGATWITKKDHKIFNIPPFVPQKPLHVEAEWHNTERDKANELSMNRRSADIFCQKIEDICDNLGYAKKAREQNKAHLETLVSVR